jgi:hypothetical protein
MAIEQMLTEEMPASALVARVLEEADRNGLRHFRRPYRPDRLRSANTRPIRTVLVREESWAVMAEIYGG